MARFAVAVVFLALGLCAWAAADEQYAYLSGVYWFDGDLYHVDVTCWNVPGNPEGGLVNLFLAFPGGTYEEGPQGWYWAVGEGDFYGLARERDHMIPPGEWLSGFKFTTDYDPGEVVYEYAIFMDEGAPGIGEFIPEHIPEPWLAGPVFLAVVATWETLRRRRRK
jgi:hypothetical protein